MTFSLLSHLYMYDPIVGHTFIYRVKQFSTAVPFQNIIMRNIIVAALALFACVVAQPGGGGANLDRIFNQYAGTDNQLTNAELNRFWLHFDDDADGSVSKQEFDSSWRQENLPNPQNAPLFFLELDRVPDEVLNSQDFPHIFRLWDENGTSVLSGVSVFTFNRSVPYRLEVKNFIDNLKKK
ncbi:unnamed protein product [Lymnaea stagnalis]|uniref:EF-hand domain-containing protein n=1 Tax=Lymnaea stagnalis TaxID=6523 RepID=A0AAV2IIW5_LYMST